MAPPAAALTHHSNADDSDEDKWKRHQREMTAAERQEGHLLPVMGQPETIKGWEGNYSVV